MRTILLAALALLAPALARAGAFDELSSSLDLSAAAEVPAPAAAELVKAAEPAECPKNMRGDASVPCFVRTPKTTVCSDGEKVSTAKVTPQEVKAGKYPAALSGKYKDEDLRAWAEHQTKLGRSARWTDGSHQSILATGKVNPFRTAYVVLPNRAWLGRKVTVCLAGGACTEAEALEVGPNSSFRDHAEVSVKVLMDLGLDAHPDSGTYYGEMVFTFH
jgi:hypothetical protein